MSERVPVQADGLWYLPAGDIRRFNAHAPGTITWEEHQRAWEAYAEKYGRTQSAERIAERGGFSYSELEKLLGHPPTTWKGHEE